MNCLNMDRAWMGVDPEDKVELLTNYFCSLTENEIHTLYAKHIYGIPLENANSDMLLDMDIHSNYDLVLHIVHSRYYYDELSLDDVKQLCRKN